MFFERREELVPGIWEYYFRPEGSVRFEPGQYVELQLPGVAGDQRGSKRTFTLTSLPTDELLSFVVKFPQPGSAYKQVLAGLQPGDSGAIGDAMGDLVLPKDAGLPLVFVAGGIGIASYASMLKQLLAKREEREIFLFYALRDRREQIYRDLTTSYPLALKTITIAPNRLTTQEIINTTPPGAPVYLSGSQRFVEGLRVSLEHQGIPRSNITFDYFDGYVDL